VFRAIEKKIRLEAAYNRGFQDALTNAREGLVTPGLDAEEREKYRYGRKRGEEALKFIRSDAAPRETN
jgi:hypothetical protein